MILKEFSDFLKNKNDCSCIKALFLWMVKKLTSPEKNNVDKIVNKEVYLAKNERGDFLMIAKSESGRTLMNALYNFALSFEQYKLAKWLHDKKANDFNIDKKE